MAIARGAGTEIIRTVHFENVVDTEMCLIFGEQHHIYTVLSIIVYSVYSNSANNPAHCWVRAWDSRSGDANQDMIIFKQGLSTAQTFVWNDKFSFNGHGPTGISGATNTVAEQDAIADQGGTVQKLFARSEHSSDNYDFHCTYIDQNNA